MVEEIVGGSNDVAVQSQAISKMTKGEILAYGAGEIYGGGYAALLGVVLTFFLTNLILIGIPNAELYAAIIIVVSKVWDAISDPLMGVISDNTRSKLGRRRPWIIIGGALVPVAFAIMFLPWAKNIQNVGLRITYACIGYFLLCTVNTISQVPYASLSAEISSDFKERNKANSVKLIYSILASGIFYLLPAAATEAYSAFINHETSPYGVMDEKGFFMIVAILCGVIFGVATVVAGIFSKERIPYDESKKSKFSFKSYAEPLKNKSYRYHLIMYITAFGCYDFISALVLYYVTAVVPKITIFGMSMSSLFIVAPMMVMAAITYPLNMKLKNTKGKQYAFRWGLPCYILGAVGLAFFPNTDNANISWLLVICAAVMGAGFGGAQMMPWLIFADTQDVAELKTGVKDTGSYSGLMTFTRKIGTAIAQSIVLIALACVGYSAYNAEIINNKALIAEAEGNIDTSQMLLEFPSSVTNAIRILFAVAVVVMISLAIWASLKYKVNDQKLTRIKYFLEKQRAGENENLTDEEKAERAALLEELG
ncbi:MAG: MFS transporter [Clostridia bacterium]|nr:MFS transporter [Clostridia bacterium]MDE7329183.1 MFS transporter [Clostridia bacterium]